jgi:hypothetical protein
MKKLNVISSINQHNSKPILTYGLIVIFFVLALSQVRVFAQSDTLGVYKTLQDFQNRKLSLISTCHGGKKNIKLNDLFDRPFITVRHDRKKERLRKSDLYGYHGCDNKDYRSFDNTEYTIVNTDKIYLYTKIIQESGDSGFGGELYFFSVHPDSKIIAMSKQNLMTAYKDNEKFKKLIDATFKKHEDLDVYAKQYLIVKLYEESMK